MSWSSDRLFPTAFPAKAEIFSAVLLLRSFLNVVRCWMLRLPAAATRSSAPHLRRLRLRLHPDPPDTPLLPLPPQRFCTRRGPLLATRDSHTHTHCPPAPLSTPPRPRRPSSRALYLSAHPLGLFLDSEEERHAPWTPATGRDAAAAAGEQIDSPDTSGILRFPSGKKNKKKTGSTGYPCDLPTGGWPIR